MGIPGESYRLNIKSESKYIFAVIVSFFIFQLFLFVKSFPALYNLYFGFVERFQVSNTFWISLLFSSELIGEVGLALRFVGACFAVAFAWLLVGKGKFVLSHLRKAVLLEGSYYLFILPFITTFFATPNTSIIYVEAGLSYALQIALVSPPLLILYAEMKKPSVNVAQLYRWGAIAVVGFTFALWVKHFFLNLYALQINLADPVLLIGLLNSALTILFGGVILLIAFLPVIRKKQANFNSKAVGAAFLLVGVYFLIYMMISLLSQSYLSYLGLTELWAVAFVVPGLGFIIGKQTG